MFNSFFSKEKNNNYIYFFIIFWALIAIAQYFAFNGIPNFICNDSFQYLSIANDIYNDKKSTGLINYSLDLYYDELALFNYDFNNLKPYHFPSYSAFLSLFYFIHNNHNFVIYFSQYLSFLIFSISSFLILSTYHKKPTAFYITIICFLCTTIISYISDSGKEILCSGLAMLGIYLGMYYKKRNKFITIIILSLIFTFLSITRNFYLLLAFLIFVFRVLPTKYKEEDLQETLKTKSIFFFFVFLIPLIAYIYCYHFIELHLFIFNNRTDFYSINILKELPKRVMANLFLGLFIFFIQYFQYVIDGFKIQGLGVLFGLYQTFGITLIGLFLYFKKEIRKIFIEKHIKVSKLFIINMFFLILISAIIVKFSMLGYRLAIGYLPIAFMIFYQNSSLKNFFKKPQYYKDFISIFIIFFIVINFAFSIVFFAKGNEDISQQKKLNDHTRSLIEETKSKKVVTSSSYFVISHLMPIFYQYPRDIYFFSSWRAKNLCADLINYHEHKIDFDIMFIVDVKECDFIDQNFYLKERNEYGLVYVKNPS